MAAREVILDGSQITTEDDFHRVISEALNFPGYYGKNLNALWDCLVCDVERPVHLKWVHSEVSKQRIGRRRFRLIVEVLEDAQKQDRDDTTLQTGRFTFELA